MFKMLVFLERAPFCITSKTSNAKKTNNIELRIHLECLRGKLDSSNNN